MSKLKDVIKVKHSMSATLKNSMNFIYYDDDDQMFETNLVTRPNKINLPGY